MHTHTHTHTYIGQQICSIFFLTYTIDLLPLYKSVLTQHSGSPCLCCICCHGSNRCEQIVSMNIGTTLPFTQLKAGHRDDKRKKNQRCSAFDFQRDADISTFQMMDQTWPSLALTFHLKRWPRVRNDAGLLNIQMHPGLTSPCFYSDLI